MKPPVTARLALLLSDPGCEDPTRPERRMPTLLGHAVLYAGDPMPERWCSSPVVGVVIAEAEGATMAFARAAVLNRVLLDPLSAWLGEFLPTE